MPIVTNTPAPPPPPQSTIRIAAPSHAGVVNDTRYEPLTALLTHIEGSSWTVNYYSQILNSDSALSGQQVNRNPIHQQYKLVKEFELKVTGPLIASQDNESKAITYSGSANVYPSIIANEGDMFIADIGDGRTGIFQVTSSEKKSIFKDAAYAIEYQLISYANPERIGDLEAKTIQTLVFVKDFLQYGQNPLIQEEDQQIIAVLQGWYGTILNRYLDTFMSNEYMTLIVPGQQAPLYDHFLVKAMLATFSTYEAPAIRYIRVLNCDDDPVMKAANLWTAMLDCDKTLLRHCFTKAGMVSARSFSNNPVMEGVRFSGVKYVVYPADFEKTTDIDTNPNVKILETKILTDSRSGVRRLADLISDKGFEGLTRPDTLAVTIKRVADDNYYVLSSAFYNDIAADKSQLEVCVTDYLNNSAPNLIALRELCSTSHSWGTLERFYYVPLLLMMVKAAIRSI